MNKILFSVCLSLSHLIAYGQVAPDLVIISGGTFEMGSNAGQAIEQPLHKVNISSFKIAKYDVTIAEFAAFVNATGYRTDAEKKGEALVFSDDSLEWRWAKGVNWRDDEEGNRRNESDLSFPVLYVSWNDATAYCNWLSNTTGAAYRLPTEAEWEYAAGNGSKHTTFSWGNNLPGKGAHVGNVRDETKHPVYRSWDKKIFKGYFDGYYFSSPVGSYPPNDFGLYDMTGNVWQWCSDAYEASYYYRSPESDPKGAEAGWVHVFRGGSWHSNPEHNHVTFRYSGAANNATPNLGFRVASSL
jgi:sulfatase modifying factor 1